MCCPNLRYQPATTFAGSETPRAQSVRRPASTDILAPPSRRDHACTLTRLTRALSGLIRAAPTVPRRLGKIKYDQRIAGFSDSTDMNSVGALRKPLAELAEHEFLEDLVRLRTISARGARSHALRAIARARAPALILFFACLPRTGKQSAGGRRVSNRSRRPGPRLKCFSPPRRDRAPVSLAVSSARRSLSRAGHVTRRARPPRDAATPSSVVSHVTRATLTLRLNPHPRVAQLAFLRRRGDGAPADAAALPAGLFDALRCRAAECVLR